MRDAPINIQDLIAVIDRPDREPLKLVTDAVILSGRLGEMADEMVDHFVQKAREAGASWADIGASIGVSKQAAQKRFVPGRRLRFQLSSRRGLFTRFGPEARLTVQDAIACAERLGSEDINTLHLVLALAHRQSGRAFEAVSSLTASGEVVANAAEKALEGQRPAGKVKHLPFGSDAKKALELSLREAIRLGNRHIGSEHVLLGVLRDGSSPGATLLNKHRVSRRDVENWLEENESL